MPRPTREDQAIGCAVDIHGNAWLIREHRATAHGFDLLIGWPEVPDGPRGAAVIMTPALTEYLASVERPRDIELPIGRTAVKKLRSALDLRFDWDAWWTAREDDLMSMTLDAFATRHQCSTGAASQRRAERKQKDGHR